MSLLEAGNSTIVALADFVFGEDSSERWYLLLSSHGRRAVSFSSEVPLTSTGH